MFSRRSSILLALTALLAAALLLGTPLAIKHYAKRWLMENGGEHVAFDDVDFNPFSARLVLKGLVVRVAEETTLTFDTASADLAWKPLFGRQVAIESVTLSGFELLIDDRPEDMLLLGGIRMPQGEKPAEPVAPPENPWLAGIETLNLNDVRVRFRDRQLDLDLQLRTLSLDNFAQWDSESFTSLQAAGVLNDAPFEVSGQLAPLAKTPRYQLKLALNGLALAPFAVLAGEHATRLAGHVSYQGDIDFSQSAAGQHLVQQGLLRLQALDVAMRQPRVNLLNRDAALEGRFELATGEGAQTLKLDQKITLNGLNIVAEDNTLELLQADTLELSGLKMDGVEQLAIDSIDITRFGFGRSADRKADDAFIDVRHFRVSDLSLADNLLSIATVSYEDGHSNMKRDAEGNFRVVGILDSMNRLIEQQAEEPPAEQPAAAPEDTPAPALDVRVERIEVGGDSRISFLDESVDPVFEADIALKSIVIENLDTRTPAQKSPFNIDAGIGKHTSIALQGTAQPFLDPVGVDIQGGIKALDLPPLSSYTRQSLGLDLDSGTLDADANALIDQKTMDGNITLRLHQLEVANVESENSLQKRIPVPLNVALDTLRDRHNTIKLDIPVKGDPANPDFSINDALSQALAKGVQQGALTYLTLALQPYGSLITAAKYAGEELNKVRLKPVEFDAGLAVIDDTDKDYLSKVAKVLGDRPQVSIKLCGVSVGADAEFLRQQAAAKEKDAGKQQAQQPAAIDEGQLRSLANDRAAAVKDHLIDNHGIPATRLVGCRPRLELNKDKAVARTDLLI